MTVGGYVLAVGVILVVVIIAVVIGVVMCKKKNTKKVRLHYTRYNLQTKYSKLPFAYVSKCIKINLGLVFTNGLFGEVLIPMLFRYPHLTACYSVAITIIIYVYILVS